MDAFSNNTHFPFLHYINIIDITAIEQFALLYQVIFGITTFYEIGSVLLTPYHVITISPDKEYRRESHLLADHRQVTVDDVPSSSLAETFVGQCCPV